MYVSMYVSMYLCIYVSMYLCMHVFPGMKYPVSLCVCIRECVHVQWQMESKIQSIRVQRAEQYEQTI